MFLTFSLLGLLYLGCVAVMVSGLATAQPETPEDAALAKQLRHDEAMAAHAQHREMSGQATAFHAA